jgi:hypothetical protein
MEYLDLFDLPDFAGEKFCDVSLDLLERAGLFFGDSDFLKVKSLNPPLFGLE